MKLLSSLLLVMTCLVMGCGRSTDGRVSASGTVTYNGQPLSEGVVTFFDGNGSAGVGMIENGSFTIKEAASSAGIQPGSYKVAIQSWESEPGALNEAGEIIAEGKSRIPEKYNSKETSGLTADVKEGSNTYEFKLEGE